MIQLLNTLFENGLYEQLYKSGLISAKLSEYRDIYLYVDAQIKTRGITQENAAIAAQVQFGCGRTKIYKAIYLLTPKN